ncbi:hypothetical protein DUNSADRAFT_8895, partial [Dunaliella salina]
MAASLLGVFVGSVTAARSMLYGLAPPSCSPCPSLAGCPTCQCAAAAESDGTCSDSSLAPLTFRTMGSTPTTSYTQCIALPNYIISTGELSLGVCYCLSCLPPAFGDTA